MSTDEAIHVRSLVPTIQLTKSFATGGLRLCTSTFPALHISLRSEYLDDIGLDHHCTVEGRIDQAQLAKILPTVYPHVGEELIRKSLDAVRTGDLTQIASSLEELAKAWQETWEDTSTIRREGWTQLGDETLVAQGAYRGPLTQSAGRNAIHWAPSQAVGAMSRDAPSISPQQIHWPDRPATFCIESAPVEDVHVSFLDDTGEHGTLHARPTLYAAQRLGTTEISVAQEQEGSAHIEPSPCFGGYQFSLTGYAHASSLPELKDQFTDVLQSLPGYPYQNLKDGLAAWQPGGALVSEAPDRLAKLKDVAEQVVAKLLQT